jgi:zinc D-Ala-D-Ala carboxypeptidase
MELTRNFTLQELTKSDTAIRKGIDNNPNADQIEKLKILCEKILQPVRDHFGRVKVTSGFRSPALCQAIGSSANSQHARAEAADFEVTGVDNVELADWIHRELEWDQLILEFTLLANPIRDGYTAASQKVCQENNFYMLIEKMVKQNTHL